MIIPTRTKLIARQAVLPTEYTTTADAITSVTEETQDDMPADAPPPPTRTTIVPNSSTAPTASSSSGGILAQAKATTNLSWWQLLCIALGGVLLLSILSWAWWRARKRKSKDEDRAKEVELEEDKRIQELVQQQRLEEGRRDRRKGTRSDSDSSWSESETSGSEESYQSVSDGGTVVPKRRKKDRRRRRRRSGRGRRGRRYEVDYSSDETDWSDETEYGRYGHRRRNRRRDRAHRSQDKRYRSRRRSYTPSPSPTPSPTPPLPPLPSRSNRSRTTKSNPTGSNFRDSVFSTYASMKRAAVQLKYVEAKAKLKQQLEEEDKIERARQAKIQEKVRQANREIELANQDESANSDRPLIPPAPTRSPSTTMAHLPTPPLRQLKKGYSADSVTQSQSRLLTPRKRQASEGSGHIPPPVPARQQTGLGAEIQDLLGRTPERQAGQVPDQRSHATLKQSTPIAQPAHIHNAFQASWLSHPNAGVAEPPSSGTGSVYLPITRPKDRPMIPPGGLAPAPPPKAKLKSANMSEGQKSLGVGVGSGSPLSGQGGKWADRLRARR